MAEDILGGPSDTLGQVDTSTFELIARKGIASGYAGLDSTGKVPSTQQIATVVNVKDPLYGAIGDGVTDDRGAIHAAIAAAEALIVSTGQPAKVVFPPGLYYVNSGSAVYAITKSLTNWLTISGYGAQVKFGTGCRRFLDFNRTADYDTFQNVIVEGFRLDFNNIGGFDHKIIGVYQNRVQQFRLNIQNITLRDIDAFNIVTNQDDSAATGDRCTGIALTSQHTATGETATFVKHIRCERVKINGGNFGITIGAATVAAGAGSTQFIDDIVIDSCQHDTGTLLAFGLVAGSLNFHIGSRGYGGRFRISNCYGRGSGDVGVEVNAGTEVLVENTTIEEAAWGGFYHTNYSAPQVPNEQIVKFRNCRARRATTATGYGFRAGMNSSISLGTVVYENCSWYRNTTDFGATGEAISFTGDAGKLRARGFEAYIEGVTGAVGTHSLIDISGTVGTVDIRDAALTFTGATAGAPTLKGLAIRGGTTIISLDNIKFSFPTLTGWNATVYTLVDLGVTGSSNIAGRVRRLICTAADGTAPRGVRVAATGTLTIPTNAKLRFLDCDFRAFPSGGTEFSFADATNQAKCELVGTDWKNPPDQLAEFAQIPTQPYDKDNGQPGMICNAWVSPGPRTLTASRTYVMRFTPSRDMRVTKVAFHVAAAAGADDSCDAGIYNSTFATLLGSSGSTAGKLNSTGAKALTLTSPVTLTAGTTYYVAHACTTFGSTAASVSGSIMSVTVNSLTDLFGTANGTFMAGSQDGATYPLVSGLTPNSGTVTTYPLLAVLET